MDESELEKLWKFFQKKILKFHSLRLAGVFVQFFPPLFLVIYLLFTSFSSYGIVLFLNVLCIVLFYAGKAQSKNLFRQAENVRDSVHLHMKKESASRVWANVEDQLRAILRRHLYLAACHCLLQVLALFLFQLNGGVILLSFFVVPLVVQFLYWYAVHVVHWRHIEVIHYRCRMASPEQMTRICR